MAKIKGKFATLNNTNYVKITIYNKAVTGLSDINIDISHDVRFAEDPIHITQMNDDTFDTIIKTQCEINLVTKRWLGDYLYSPNLTDIVVNVWYGDDCVFAGYVLPMTFKQNYSHVWENVTIKCQDILSTLKDRRLTDKTDYAELVAQSTVRPFSWFINQMGIDDASVVIPNLPDVNTEYMEMAWIETGWMRVINDDNTIDYYGIDSECIILDETTAVATGNERQGEQKEVTWVLSEDTTIINGVSYFKEYSHITVAGQDVNTGDWRAYGETMPDMPEYIGRTEYLDGWTRGALPQPFQYYEHFSVVDVYSNGLETQVSDYIGEQIPETPLETSYGSYYEFRQGPTTDIDIDETTNISYFKNYSWCVVNGVAQNTGDWVRGDRTPYIVGSRYEVTGWQYDEPATPFEYYETVSYYDIYSDNSERFSYNALGDQIPLAPDSTSYGYHYELRQGDPTDYTTYENVNYYKDYGYVCYNNACEKTSDWQRGDVIPSEVVDTVDRIESWNYIYPTEDPMQFCEIINHYNVYLDGHEVLTGYSEGDEIPLYPETTSHGSYHEYRRGGPSDYVVYENQRYYKNYVWISVCGAEPEWTQFYWVRGDLITDTGQIIGTTTGVEPKMQYEANGNTIIDTSNVHNNQYEFYGIPSTITHMNFSQFGNVYDMTFVEIDTSNITDMSNLFMSIPFRSVDLHLFDTSNVTNMSNMFCGCKFLLHGLDLSNFDTSNVTDMSRMFYDSNIIDFDISSFDTSNVRNMTDMFGFMSQIINLDLSHFDTSKVTNMTRLFYYDGNLETLDLSGWDMSLVTDMRYMFRNCYHLASITLNDVNDNTFNKITNNTVTNLDSNVVIYRDGDTYTYKSNQNKWTKD